MQHTAINFEKLIISSFAMGDCLKDSSFYINTIKGYDRFVKSNHLPLSSNNGQIIFKIKNASLQYFPANSKELIFIVPSLINKAYIFNLSDANSFIKKQNEAGKSVVLLNWGEVDQSVDGFGINDYLNEILIPATNFVFSNFAEKQISLTGYCLGSIFCLFLSTFFENKFSRINLLAPIVDFSHFNIPHNVKYIVESAQKEIKGQEINNFFYSAYAKDIADKFYKFSFMKENSQKYVEFLDKEYWLHDCICITKNLAKDLFIEIGLNNALAKNVWQINGNSFNLENINYGNIFLYIGSFDKISPESSASYLVQKAKKVFKLNTGHLGLVLNNNHL